MNNLIIHCKFSQILIQKIPRTEKSLFPFPSSNSGKPFIKIMKQVKKTKIVIAQRKKAKRGRIIRKIKS